MDGATGVVKSPGLSGTIARWIGRSKDGSLPAHPAELVRVFQ
jgi:hypothetical protein